MYFVISTIKCFKFDLTVEKTKYHWNIFSAWHKCNNQVFVGLFKINAIIFTVVGYLNRSDQKSVIITFWAIVAICIMVNY